MIDCQAFQQRGRFSHDVVVVAGLRGEQGGLQHTRITHTRGAAVTVHQHGVHAEHIGHGQVIARHRLLGQFTVEAVELMKARRERGHHMARTFLLLPVDVVALGVIQHRLELASLARCIMIQLDASG